MISEAELMICLKIVRQHGPMTAKDVGGRFKGKSSAWALRRLEKLLEDGHAERGIPGNRYKWFITDAGREHLSILRAGPVAPGPTAQTVIPRGQVALVPGEVYCRFCAGYGFVLSSVRGSIECANCDGTGKALPMPSAPPGGDPSMMIKHPKYNTGELITERASNYGDFTEGARLMQSLKDTMRSSKNWEILPHYMRESLDMMQHKISRILNGRPRYLDSWDDILGYGRLVIEQLEKEGETRP